jgi:gamma-glutamylcyclotransferase (GGCT)/AIG2-like uncharacterized protein YtfP
MLNSCENAKEKGRDGKWYFAYGSNMNPERIKERLDRKPKAKRGRLGGYRLAFNKIADGKTGIGYANIVASEGDVVFGVLYSVTEEDLRLLDIFEGVADGHYFRANVTIVLDGGEELLATTYMACQNRTAQSLKPTREYLKHLLKGKEFLPSDYVTGLERIAVADQ